MNKEDALNSLKRSAMAYQRATVLIEGSPDSQIKGAMHELHNAVAGLIAAVEFIVEG